MTQTQQGFPNISAPFVDAKTGRLNQAWFQLLINLWNRTGGSQGGSTVPTGQIIAYGAADIPGGWLPCDGSAVSRATYANLFGTIGVTWGPGDGFSTFNVPDLRSRFPLGADTTPVGNRGGSNQVTVAIANLPAHNHGITDPGHTHAVTDPGHVHTVATGTTGTGNAGSLSASGTTNTGSATTGLTVNSAVTGISTQNTGGGTPLDVTPAFAAVTYLIKT